MKNTIPSLGHLESILANPDRGVLGLVDGLLQASRQHDVQLGWQAGCVTVIVVEGGDSHRIEAPLGRSVVRAALARIAALCNDRSPGSVSPYGGQGVVANDDDPSTAIRATFVNTPETQSLELASVSSEVVSLVDPSHAKSSQ